MSEWKVIRAAIGVADGEPADAIEDTAALYDDEPRLIPFAPYRRTVSVPSQEVPGTAEWLRSRLAEHLEIAARGEKERAAARIVDAARDARV